MKVRAIYPAGVADVYNMEVDDIHDFAINGGIIAHNCYDELRYVCMENPIAPRPAAAAVPRAYDPLSLESGGYDRYEFYRRY